MLIREGLDRDPSADRRLASLLAAIAGALNAAAFYAVGFFAANMTGNVSALSWHVATGEWLLVLFYVSIICFFVVGAAIATLLLNIGRQRGISGVYAYGVLAEAILLATLGGAEFWLPAGWHMSVLVLGLAFLMGLQNALVTRISGARVRTTHVSGMATDIGIELAVAYEMRGGRASLEEVEHNAGKLRLHLYTILAFLAGGVAGVLAFRSIGGWLLIICAVVLLGIAANGLTKARKLRPVAAP